MNPVQKLVFSTLRVPQRPDNAYVCTIGFFRSLLELGVIWNACYIYIHKEVLVCTSYTT